MYAWCVHGMWCKYDVLFVGGMEWEVFDKVLEALLATVQGFSSYMQVCALKGSSTLSLLKNVRFRLVASRRACVPTSLAQGAAPRVIAAPMLILKRSETSSAVW